MGSCVVLASMPRGAGFSLVYVHGIWPLLVIFSLHTYA